jgi:hypothetical protein
MLPTSAMMLLTMMMVCMTIHIIAVEALNSALFRRTSNISVSNFTVSTSIFGIHKSVTTYSAEKPKNINVEIIVF